MQENPRIIIIVKGGNVITNEHGQPIGAIIPGDASLDYYSGVQVVLEQKVANMHNSSPAIHDPAGDQVVPIDHPNLPKDGTVNYGY